VGLKLKLKLGLKLGGGGLILARRGGLGTELEGGRWEGRAGAVGQGEGGKSLFWWGGAGEGRGRRKYHLRIMKR
jgi:hypothetical protein